MKLEDYTPDNICVALGVGEFAPQWRRGLPPRQLRVLLTPSRHAEVCITISEIDEAPLSVSVASAREQIWASSFGGGADTALVASSVSFEEIEVALRGALPIGPQGGIAIDGMQVHIAYRSLSATVHSSCNPASRESLAAFVAAIIRRTWEACDNVRVRNALANAARYVDLALPVEDVEPEPARTTIAIIGSPQERAELLDAVRVVRDRKP